jgi:hypothetical protein
LDLEYLALYSSNCLSCKHLCETGVRDFQDCHFSSGNKQCPASEVRLVVVGEALQYARRVLRARDKRQPKREARLMQYVGKQSAAFQSRFYEYLDNGGRSNLKG